MKTKTVPFSVLRVAHPTVIGQTIALHRIVGTPEQESMLAKIGDKARESGQRLRSALSDIVANDTQS